MSSSIEKYLINVIVSLDLFLPVPLFYIIQTFKTLIKIDQVDKFESLRIFESCFLPAELALLHYIIQYFYSWIYTAGRLSFLTLKGQGLLQNKRGWGRGGGRLWVEGTPFISACSEVLRIFFSGSKYFVII